jgi:hypothetical protein
MIHTKYFCRHGEIVIAKEEQQLGDEGIIVKDEPEGKDEQPFVSCMTVKMEHPLDSLTVKEEESQQIKEEPLVAQESASEGYKVLRPESLEEQRDGKRKKPRCR